MDILEKIDNVLEEGKKAYKIEPQIGKVKHSVSFYDGKSTHKDGSDFWGIKTFKNKKQKEDFVKELQKDGYVEK